MCVCVCVSEGVDKRVTVLLKLYEQGCSIFLIFIILCVGRDHIV